MKNQRNVEIKEDLETSRYLFLFLLLQKCKVEETKDW